jgi:hypothetical protein
LTATFTPYDATGTFKNFKTVTLPVALSTSTGMASVVLTPNDLVFAETNGCATFSLDATVNIPYATIENIAMTPPLSGEIVTSPATKSSSGLEAPDLFTAGVEDVIVMAPLAPLYPGAVVNVEIYVKSKVMAIFCQIGLTLQPDYLNLTAVTMPPSNVAQEGSKNEPSPFLLLNNIVRPGGLERAIQVQRSDLSNVYDTVTDTPELIMTLKFTVASTFPAGAQTKRCQLPGCYPQGMGKSVFHLA